MDTALKIRKHLTPPSGIRAAYGSHEMRREVRREVSERVATRVIEQAFAEGVARTTRTTPEAVGAHVRAKGWQPRYLPFEKVVSS